MKWLVAFCLCLGILCAENPAPVQKKYNIGLCVMATGKYDVYAQRMIESARVYFCKNHNVTFFVFTKGEAISTSPDIVKVAQDRLGWPFDTLKRCHVYEANKEAMKEMDYLFAVDADMLFVGPVGDEILGDLVGTQHPAFVNKRGTYEKNKKSRAFVSKKEGKTYYAGGFWGGKKEEFLKLASTMREQVELDLKNGIIAKWHDESHLNRYFIDHPPSRTLDPSYCYPESWQLSYPKKLIALDKNHGEMRK